MSATDSQARHFSRRLSAATQGLHLPSEDELPPLDDLAALQLSSVEGIDWTWTTWADFLRELGAPHRRLNERRFNSYVIALQAARSGQGVALGWASLVMPLIKSGDLVQLTDAEIAAPQSYFVTWSAHRPLSRPATTLKTGFCH